MGSGIAYLDASAIIRIVQGAAHLSDAIRQLVSGHEVVSSVVSITECLCGPLRDRDEPILTLYRGFFAATGIELIPVDDALAQSAAQLRAEFRLRTPDAIHFATALARQCNTFLTSDRDFTNLDGVGDMTVVLLPAV
ncbi:MAG: type II toxin-antitoxin system VapC family toxin [Burkholderiales bacterium]|nr:type II toxin-antitoxin system VapC family toxin [Phycisphaerae bacterium]